jgi:hypothetical protein
VLCEGERLGHWRTNRAAPALRRVRIPRWLASRPELALTLHVDAPGCPAIEAGSDDRRKLGLGVRSLRIGRLGPKDLWRRLHSRLAGAIRID